VVLLAATLAAPSVGAEGRSGALIGWVEDHRGAPIAGALVSVFAKGAVNGGFVTFSDSSGHFSLASLPAGLYTLRALAADGMAAPARQISVLPNRPSIFTLSLAPNPDAEMEEAAVAEGVSPRGRELRWLLRHKRRSVLEDRGHAAGGERGEAPRAADLTDAIAPWLGEIDGSIELVTTPMARGSTDEGPAGQGPASLGLVRLSGRFADAGHWSVGGLLAESEDDLWRMAGEFVVEPGGGHEIRAGTGYGTRFVVPLLPASRDGRAENQRVGAIFLEDRWHLSDRLTAAAGARYSHIGFLRDSQHVDPALSIAFHPGARTALRGGITARTVPPGGDLLTLSALASSTALAHALSDDEVRAEKILRYDFTVDHALGNTSLGGHFFHETVNDRLVSVFGGPAGNRFLRVLNGPSVAAKGAGLTLSRSFGGVLRGSLSYTYGQASNVGDDPDKPGAISFRPDGEFHDVVARVETVIERSATRVRVYCRVNRLSPDTETTEASDAIQSTRFDVQLSQGLPFLGGLTRADWDLLFALRNLLYEPEGAAALDEMTVSSPPMRVLGGLSLSF